ncbi:MAG TPA: ShlB/FhaC/HecB family hemolysin secretion/activation protein [Steroidobacteraceae bacterium]|nr:ShlB/FhaC/HecB family hemolysin secretion/activation protein [Steroidobacteraceae bacterium]
MFNCIHVAVAAVSCRVGARIILAAALLPIVCHAQVPPDAGSLLKQIERPQQPALPPKGEPQFLPPPVLSAFTGESIVVREFQFAGNTRLASKQLTVIVAGFKGRPLTFAELQNAAIAVATAYRKAGWIVRVYLPQQDVTQGTVTIQIIEAKFGVVRVEGKTHASAARLTRMVEHAQKSTQTVNADSLDRALLLVNDLPGVTAKGRLDEGQNPGETDLVMTLADGRRVSGDIVADNGGARSTGLGRAIASASLNSPFGLGDRIDAMLLHSLGSDYQRAGYSLPIGSDGWRLGVNGSHLRYRVVTAAFAALDAQGTSTTVGAEASYPLVRASLHNLYFSFSLDDQRFDNKSMGFITSAYSVRSVRAGLYGNLFDTFGAGGANNASISLEQGSVDLGNSPNEGADALTTRTAGSFRKLNFSAGRQQAITSRFSLYADLSGQVANKNLDSSEKFYLGGLNGVRAYPANEGGGSTGVMLNLEARERLPLNLDLTGFFDIGVVHFNKNNDFVGAAAPNRDELKGLGLTLGWTASMGLNLKATVARRIGSNPDRTSTGTDQDGSLDMTRFWIQASVPF